MCLILCNVFIVVPISILGRHLVYNDDVFFLSVYIIFLLITEINVFFF